MEVTVQQLLFSLCRKKTVFRRMAVSTHLSKRDQIKKTNLLAML